MCTGWSWAVWRTEWHDWSPQRSLRKPEGVETAACWLWCDDITGCVGVGRGGWGCTPPPLWCVITPAGHSTMYGQQCCTLTVMCLGLNHLSFATPTFPLTTPLFLVRLYEGESIQSDGRVHGRKSCWCLVNAANLSVLLGRDLAFLIMTDRRAGLCPLLWLRGLTLARHSHLLLHSSQGILGRSAGFKVG